MSLSFPGSWKNIRGLFIFHKVYAVSLLEQAGGASIFQSGMCCLLADQASWHIGLATKIFPWHFLSSTWITSMFLHSSLLPSSPSLHLPAFMQRKGLVIAWLLKKCC